MSLRGMRLGSRGGTVAAAVLLGGFAALFVVAFAVWIRPWDHRKLEADLAAGAAAGLALVEAMPLPAGAAAAGPPEVATELHRGARASVTLVVDAPGRFRDSAAFHAGRLLADGWSPVAGRDGDLAAAFCRPPNLLELEERSRVGGASPNHRYAIRLHWAPGIDAAHCRRLS